MRCRSRASVLPADFDLNAYKADKKGYLISYYMKK